MEPYLFQALESTLRSAIKKANQVLDASVSGKGTTADELESTVDELHKAIESVVSVGLGKSHPLVAKATELGNSLRSKVSAVYVCALFQGWE